MIKRSFVFTCLLVCASPRLTAQPKVEDSVLFAGEKHFKNIQQLTFGGDNAEAYWSFDGKYIIFQRTNPKEGFNCDQIFIGKVPKPGEKFTYKMVSSGKGRTTCSYFLPDGKHILYASTHKAQIAARRFQTGLSMAINISGLCMTATIFLWPISMERSLNRLPRQKGMTQKALYLPMEKNDLLQR
jgi:hypothetical protein